MTNASPRPYVGCSAHPSRFSPIDDVSCGSVQARDLSTRLKIVGGREASSGAWPWQVAILDYKHDPICGGTLLTPEFILTAAHCVKKKMYVRAGEHNIDIYEGTEQEQRVTRSFIHNKYDPNIVDSDIALLKLKTPFRLNRHVWPACLPPANEELKPTTVATILGWGVVHELPADTGVPPTGGTIIGADALLAMAINMSLSHQQQQQPQQQQVAQSLTGSDSELLARGSSASHTTTATATTTTTTSTRSTSTLKPTHNNTKRTDARHAHKNKSHNQNNNNHTTNRNMQSKSNNNNTTQRRRKPSNGNGHSLISAKCPGSDVLLQARVPIVSADDCRNVYKDYTISDNMLCAGYKRGRVDTCAGDSGGPLLVQRQNKWHVFGVTSFGEGCGKQGKYGIYSKTSNFVDWIRMMINKHSSFMTMAGSMSSDD
ncbi:Plasma kallikrein, partial [Fragariocoptes setiger]